MKRLIAVLLWLAWLALASAALAVRWLHADPHFANDLSFFAVMVVFATMGTVLAVARPSNPIGWLLYAMAVFDAQNRLGSAIVTDLPQLISASLPVAVVVAIGQPLNSLLLGETTLILLLFPDGRMLSPRWRVAASAPLALVASGALAGLLAAGPIRPLDSAAVAKPFGIEALVPVAAILFYVSFIVGILGVLVGAASLFQRYRSGGSVQRQQVKWMAAAASLIALHFLTILGTQLVITFLPGVVDDVVVRRLMNVSQHVVPLSLPIAIGIAVLRYRLYDIDLLINRALVYGALSATLLAAYLLSVLTLSALLRPLTGSSDLAVAGSTLAVVAAFGPLRARIQTAVDRRFYRSRYDAARTVEAFGARLRDQIDLDELSGELVSVIHETLRPAHASLWLRQTR